MRTIMLADVSGLEGSRFDVRLSKMEAHELKLVEVRDKGSVGPYEQFSLFLQGGANRFLPQGGYVLEHQILGELHWFLVPVGKTENGFLYEAAFSVRKQNGSEGA